MRTVFFIRCLILALMVWFNLDLALADDELEDIKDSSKKKKSLKSSSNDFDVILSREFNFSETSILGGMKTPDGFYLQGSKSQDLKDMVKLRNSFKQEIIDSYSGVHALAK